MHRLLALSAARKIRREGSIALLGAKAFREHGWEAPAVLSVKGLHEDSVSI